MLGGQVYKVCFFPCHCTISCYLSKQGAILSFFFSFVCTHPMRSTLIKRVKSVLLSLFYTEFSELLFIWIFPIQFARYLIFSFFFDRKSSIQKPFPKVYTSFHTTALITKFDIPESSFRKIYLGTDNAMMPWFIISCIHAMYPLLFLIYGVKYLTIKTGEEGPIFILAWIPEL